MWIFTRYGFFSIVSASITYPLSDERMMIRAYRRQHLQALQARFPELSSLEIEIFTKRDYRYCIYVAREFWEFIAAELVREQDWYNFRDEAVRFQGASGADYGNALEQVLGVMKVLQATEPGQSTPNPLPADDSLTWDGIVDPAMLNDDADRQTLADQAKAYDWAGVFATLAKHPELVNTARPGGKTRYTPLHQAAHGGASIAVPEKLISLGAWRSLRNANGERAVDIARRQGHSHLFAILEPVYKRQVPGATLAAIQNRFHELIREAARENAEKLWLPELEPLLEYELRSFWFAVPGMYGGFRYWLAVDGADAHLAAQSWCRVVGGSGRHHDISEHQTRLIDHSFV